MARWGLAQIAIAACFDLFPLRGFHEAFGLGGVVRIADAAHTALDVPIQAVDTVMIGKMLVELSTDELIPLEQPRRSSPSCSH
jgi:hypothetical protein